MESILEQAWWAPALIWAALFVSDYTLTHIGRGLYGALQGRYLQFDSYELNPLWKKTIESGRWWSPRFAVVLILTTGVAAYGGFLASGPWETAGQGHRVRMIMSVAFGAVFLLEGAIHVRHVRNLVLFRSLANATDVEGLLRYPRWFSYRMSSIDFAAFAALFVTIALLDQSPFCLGGAIAAIWTALRHREYSRAALATRTPPKIGVPD